jgi:hypothetical protein
VPNEVGGLGREESEAEEAEEEEEEEEEEPAKRIKEGQEIPHPGDEGTELAEAGPDASRSLPAALSSPKAEEDTNIPVFTVTPTGEVEDADLP